MAGRECGTRVKARRESGGIEPGGKRDRGGPRWFHPGLVMRTMDFGRIPARPGVDLESIAQSDRDFEAFHAGRRSVGRTKCSAFWKTAKGIFGSAPIRDLTVSAGARSIEVTLPDPGRTDAIAALKNRSVVMIVFAINPGFEPWSRMGKQRRLKLAFPRPKSVQPKTTRFLGCVTSRGFGRLSGKGVSCVLPNLQLKSLREIGCSWNSVWVSDAIAGRIPLRWRKRRKVPSLRPQVSYIPAGDSR